MARKGIDSLAALCREKLHADPFSGCLFIFRSRRAQRSRSSVTTARGFGWRTSDCRKGGFAGGRRGSERAQALQAHQAQLLLAAGNPETEAAPVWRKVS